MGKIIGRWALLFFAGLVLFLVARFFLTWGKSDLLTGQANDFLNRTTSQVVETGSKVLGQTIEQAPVDPKIKEAIIRGSGVFSSDNQDQLLKDLSPEQIGEAVKAMPANQAKEIKKEIFGDFCQEILDD